jgi:WD40 repeat protein
VTPDGTRILTGSSDKTARVWDSQTGAELLRIKGHTDAINGIAATPDGARILTSSSDKTARVWDSQTGAELLRIKGHTDAIKGIAATPDGARIVTGSQDATARLWDLAQLRPPPAQHKVTPQTRQALIDHAKAVVPRCLMIDQRGDFLLRPQPPGWCIDMGKYPYDTEQWKDRKAGKMVDTVDSTTAEAYGKFADNALKAGNDFRVALEATELGLMFDPKQTWITMNKAHALMFLDRIQDARREYLAHRGTRVPGYKLWEEAVVDDFSLLRERGREHPLMIEIEQLFKPSLPVETGE